jgi:transposase InsO family protein
MHRNARTTPLSRAVIVQEVLQAGHSRRAVATALLLSEKTVRKWTRSYERRGARGLETGTSCPHAVVPVEQRPGYAQVQALRLLRCSYSEISQRTGLSRATVSRWLRRVGLNRLPRLQPTVPVVRYEREHPGDLLHLDIKKLGRIRTPGHRITGDRRSRKKNTGWEYLHIAIDDHTRLSVGELYPDERGPSATSFLRHAVAYYRRFGVTIREVMTDNGSPYVSHLFRQTCQELGLRHIRTRPYTPRTNGKAERFIQTALKEWAYAHSYGHSKERAATLPLWLHRYNWHRPHQALHMNPPIARIALSADNLVRLHS